MVTTNGYETQLSRLDDESLPTTDAVNKMQIPRYPRKFHDNQTCKLKGLIWEGIISCLCCAAALGVDRM